MSIPVAELSTTQRTVLRELMRLGEATASELAEALGISSSAVRQHLSALRSADVVTSRRQRGQQGRPAERWFATEQAEPLVAANDSKLSIEILEQVEAEDPDLVGRIFDRRRSDLVDRCRERVAGKPAAERIDVVTQLLDEDGYLANLERVDDGHYRINLHSCAIWPVASRFRQACNAELTFIQQLLPDAAITRVTHKTAGAHTCVYEVHIGI